MTRKTKYHHSVHNSFVTAKYSLTKIEGRIFLDLLKRIHKGDTKFYKVSYTRQEIMNFFPGHEVSHREIEDTLNKLFDKQIYFKSEDLNDPKQHIWVGMAWVDLPDYKDGKYILKLSDSLIPYLTGLIDNFTLIDIEAMMNMSPHNRRLYMLCRRSLNWKFRDISVNHLIEIMGLGNSYREPRTLRQRVLKPAEAEINKLPDIRVTFAVEKKSKMDPQYMVYFNVTDEDGKNMARNTKQGLLDRHAVKRGSIYVATSHGSHIDLHNEREKYRVTMSNVNIISSKE